MIRIEKIDPKNEKQALAFISWYSDAEMIKNWLLHGEGESKKIEYSISEFQKDFAKSDKTAFMISNGLKYIGYGSFYINHPVGKFKDGRTCWPSIGIGDRAARGKGFGLEICKEILKLSRELDCTHIEAGVFEFNHKMKKILKENHFKFIGKEPNKTFVDGKWWASEHYLLEL